MSRIVVIGDSLLDRDVHGSVERLTPDAPAPVLEDARETTRPGGAGLAALLAANDGHRVELVTALSDDEAGGLLYRLLRAAGVQVHDLGLAGPTCQKVRYRCGDTSLLRVDTGRRTTSADVGPLDAKVVPAIAAADAVLVACYGRGVSASAALRELLTVRAAETPVVWDPHPSGPAPVPGVRLATPNGDEARRWVPDAEGGHLAAATERARALRERWSSHAVALTLGAHGALLVDGSELPLVVPTSPVGGGDVCGAGDRFATAATAALARGSVTSEAVEHGVEEATRYVSRGGPTRVGRPGDEATLPGEDALTLAARVRRNGGTVVATGGCFDLLHAGHVRLLEAARSLGDCLIVCLNSDASVRGLKGAGRPVNPAAERAELLRSLRAVDAVIEFGDATPEAVLGRLRPDVFAKGADYRGAGLPETATLAAWGGRTVTLPFHPGRSSTHILQGGSAT